MGKKYKKILFDLDNTLIDDNENRKYAIRKILKEMDKYLGENQVEDFIKSDDKYWQDRASKKLKDPYEFKTIEEKTKWVRAQRFIMFFKDISFEEAVEINDKYINYLKEKIIPIEGAKETLEYLYNKNYEINIVTNGPTVPAKSKLEKTEISKYINLVFTAEEAGFMKPHKEFFDEFYKKIGTKNVDEMLIIGDELEKDVLGGIENNIDTCWFNSKNSKNDPGIKPDMEIKKLVELKNIL